MSDEKLVYEFYVSTYKRDTETSEEIDLIAEGYVGSLEEWEDFRQDGRFDILDHILRGFVEENTISGWSKA